MIHVKNIYNKRSRNFLKIFWIFFRNFRGNSSKKFDFGRRSSALAHPGSRELRAVKIPASYDAWRPPKFRKNDSEKILIFCLGNQFFIFFFWILEGIYIFWRQNQFPCEILLQIHLFWGLCDKKLRKNDLCRENLASASPTRARPNLYLGGGGCRPSPINIKW